MSHIVIHDDSSNVTHYAEFDEVQAAAAYLEGLVTEDSESNARLFALEPVEFAVRSYVRVEIGDAAVEESAPEAQASTEEPAPAEATGDTNAEATDETAASEVFTDAPAVDDTVEYVEAAMAPVEAFTPVPAAEPAEEQAGGETRRGLFGR